MVELKSVASLFSGFLLVSTCVYRVVSKQCFHTDQMLTADGECVDCPFCPGGQGMDLEEQVPVNQDGDPLECRICKPCGRGYYNDPEDHQYGCRLCPPPCVTLNRKEHTPCGGSTIGHCDGCINSDFEDRDNNLYSPCRRRNESRSTPTSLNQPPVTDESGPPLEPERTERARDAHNDRADGLSIEWICLIITLILLVFIVVACVVYRQRITERCCQGDPELAREVSSKATMISSTCTTSSSLFNSGLNIKCNLSSDSDLDADTPMLPGGEVNTQPSRARRELMSSNGMPSSGPECLHVVQPRPYPTFLLTANDKYIKYASEHIFDEGKINSMFREMGLSDQFIYSEHTRYLLEKQTYDDMVIHYLQKWVAKAGRSATFDVLCMTLDKHGFPDVSDILLKMYHGHDRLG